MFNVSISIDDVMVSTKINGVDDFWLLMIPALLARGFEFPFQIMYSLHNYVEKDGKHVVIEKAEAEKLECFDTVYDSGYKAGWDARGEYEKSCS